MGHGNFLHNDKYITLMKMGQNVSQSLISHQLPYFFTHFFTHSLFFDKAIEWDSLWSEWDCNFCKPALAETLDWVRQPKSENASAGTLLWLTMRLSRWSVEWLILECLLVITAVKEFIFTPWLTALLSLFLNAGIGNLMGTIAVTRFLLFSV